MSLAYKSVLDISFSVRAGLLIRQTHHWAADVFLAAIVLHLLRVFFTGAFRAPRTLTYYLGLTMLVLSLLEGYLGYSLGDDLLSGMGLAIGYAVALSVPFVGANLAALIWGGPFPGSASFWPRIYIIHVLVLPVLIGTLLVAHLALVAARHHTQFRESSRHSERRIVGVPGVPRPGAALARAACSRSSRVLFLLGGLVQINPVWLWGPYHVGLSTNGAQPDWYLGWLIGALRLVPGFDVVVDRRTRHPEPLLGRRPLPGDRLRCCSSSGRPSSGGSAATARATTCSSDRARTRGGRRSARRCSAGSSSSSWPARPTASTCSSASTTRPRSTSTACSSG